MEPMTLGSPSSPGPSNFLPNFLMGDNNTPVHNRNALNFSKKFQMISFSMKKRIDNHYN